MLQDFAVRIFTLAAINSYSRDQETEADLAGFKFSPNGVDPLYTRFFETMKENQSSLERSGLFDWPLHPTTPSGLLN